MKYAWCVERTVTCLKLNWVRSRAMVLLNIKFRVPPPPPVVLETVTSSASCALVGKKIVNVELDKEVLGNLTL